MFVLTPEIAVAGLVAVAVWVMLTVAIARRFGWALSVILAFTLTPYPAGVLGFVTWVGLATVSSRFNPPVTTVQPPLATPLNLAALTPRTVPVRVVPTRVPVPTSLEPQRQATAVAD